MVTREGLAWATREPLKPVAVSAGVQLRAGPAQKSCDPRGGADAFEASKAQAWEWQRHSREVLPPIPGKAAGKRSSEQAAVCKQEV